jgi:hypothetical protein
MLNDKFNKYECLFKYFNKKAKVYFSYSITANGRGIGSNTHFIAAVPFPQKKHTDEDCFFITLHEFTHQFTDCLINSNISMNNNTHALSENIVIFADYYLLKMIDETKIDMYFNWICKISGHFMFYS